MITASKTQANRAEVRLRNERVGFLAREQNRYIFKYDDTYLNRKEPIAIAINFPLRKEEYISEKLHSFFDNLIMEGWLLNQTEKEFHVDKKNRWALLMLVGANPLGAVSIHAQDNYEQIFSEELESSENDSALFEIKIATQGQNCSFCLNSVKPPSFYHSACYKKFWGSSKSLLVKLDKSNPVQTFSKTVHDGSISGAQRKGLFALSKNTLFVNSADSTYIFKPSGDFPELPANEHLTMTAARQLNFDVPPTALIDIEEVGLVFVIKRFDRVNKYRLLLEDMAQICQEVSEDKYSLSHERVGQAISIYTQAGPLNLNDYFRRILFCYLTANGDMHLKNWSLLEMENNPGIYRLSPVYDWLNTRIALPREKDDLAIPLLGKKNKMQKSYFKKFAHEILGLNSWQIEKTFSEIPFWINVLDDLIPKSFLSKKLQQSYRDILNVRKAIF